MRLTAADYLYLQVRELFGNAGADLLGLGYFGLGPVVNGDYLGLLQVEFG
jgi:hypothetical protein